MHSPKVVVNSVLFVCLFAAGNARMVLAAETPEEVGAFLMEAAWKQAETLKTGVYSGTDMWKDEPVGKPAIVSEGEFHGAFDFNSSRVRFDYRSLTDAMVNFHYLENPKECVLYSEAQRIEITRGPFDGSPSRNREFFDVRCLGLMTLDEVASSLLLPETKEGLIKGMGKVTGRKPEQGSIWQLD